MSNLAKVTERNITLVSTMSSGKTMYENVQVSTVGELKAVLGSSVVNNMNIAALDAKRGKHAFEFDDTVLPAGDLAVFLSPKKQRGASTTEAEVDKMDFVTLRRFVKTNNIAGGGANPSKDLLRKLIKNFIKDSVKPVKKRADKIVVKEKIKTNLKAEKAITEAPVQERTKVWKEKFQDFIKSAQDLKGILDPKLADNKVAIERIEKSNTEMSTALTIIDSVLDYTKDQEITDETPEDAIPLGNVVEGVKQHIESETFVEEENLDVEEEEEDEDLDDDDEDEESEDEEIETPPTKYEPSKDTFKDLDASDIAGMFK